MEGLVETKSQIEAAAPGMNVHLVHADLGDLASLQQVFSEIVSFADQEAYQQYVLIHNAGTTGDMTKPAIQQSDPKPIQEYLAVNFTSMFVLTSQFLSHFSQGDRWIVNMTSSLASKYVPSVSLYSSVKAARNALMGVLAAENSDVHVLSYHPGACDTDMFRSAAEQSYSESYAQNLRQRYAEKTVVTCKDSISKLVTILKEDNFENGAFLDYYSYKPTSALS